MISPFMKEVLNQLNQCLIDNGDGTFTVRTIAGTGSSTAKNPKLARTSNKLEISARLFSTSAGVTSLNVK